MGIQHKLAKLTPGSPGMEPGSGGIPTLTAQDVAAALGYVSGRVPAHNLGAHLVLAKYTDDVISITLLERKTPRLAWLTYWDLGLSGSVNRRTINLLSKLALADYCESGRFTQVDAERMAALVKVSDYYWRTRYSKIYAELQRTFSELENPVLRIVFQTLAN